MIGVIYRSMRSGTIGIGFSPVGWRGIAKQMKSLPVVIDPAQFQWPVEDLIQIYAWLKLEPAVVGVYDTGIARLKVAAVIKAAGKKKTDTAVNSMMVVRVVKMDEIPHVGHGRKIVGTRI